MYLSHKLGGLLVWLPWMTILWAYQGFCDSLSHADLHARVHDVPSKPALHG